MSAEGAAGTLEEKIDDSIEVVGVSNDVGDGISLVKMGGLEGRPEVSRLV